MEVFQKKFDKYLTDGNQAVQFKIVKNAKDVSSNSTNDEFTFSPLMCHQIFGEKEQIFGHVQPKLTVYYCTSTLDTYLEFEHKVILIDLYVFNSVLNIFDKCFIFNLLL